MAYNRTQASTLLSADEMVLFDASLADRVKALGAAELRKQVKRTRTLRDKSSDLLQRQKIATRGRTGTKLGPGGDANERTERKVLLLGETLARFEKRLALLEPAAQPEAKGPAGKALAPPPASAPMPPQPGAPVLPPRSVKAPAVGPMAGKLTGPGSDSARAMAKTSKLQDKGSRAIQGHVSVVGRHNQAKRDGRR